MQRLVAKVIYFLYDLTTKAVFAASYSFDDKTKPIIIYLD